MGFFAFDRGVFVLKKKGRRETRRRGNVTGLVLEH